MMVIYQNMSRQVKHTDMILMRERMEGHIRVVMILTGKRMDMRIQCIKMAMINIMMMTIIVRQSNGRDRQNTQKIGRNRQIGRKTVTNQTDMHINMILISEHTEEHTDTIRMNEHMDVRTPWTKKETGRNLIIRSLQKHGRKMMENLDQNTSQRRNIHQKTTNIIHQKMNQKITKMNLQKMIMRQ